MKYFTGIEKHILSNIEQYKHKVGEFALLNNDKTIQDFIANIESAYSLQCMLAIYYPPGGGLDWHTNEDANMYNAICTYSTSDKSFIQLNEKKVYDKKNKWTVKFTHWNQQEPIPHRVVSVDHRISFAFCSPKKQLVQSFIDELI